MKRLRSLLALAVCISGLAAACAAETTAPSSTAPDERTELAAAQVGYYAVRRSVGDAHYVARVDDALTTCADRAQHDDCRLAELDLTRLDLTPGDEAVLRARASEAGAVIWQGKLVRSPGIGDKLVVAVAWMRRAVTLTNANVPPPKGGLHILRDVHEGCTTSDRCAWLRMEPIDGTRPAHHTSLDMSMMSREIDDATKQAIAHGQVLALGVSAGPVYIAGALYSPWNVMLPAASTPVR